ncbi:MAG: radical SAM protein [bacterium]
MGYYSSPFNIVLPCGKDNSSSIVHNLVTNEVYTFRERWNKIVYAANKNDELANKLSMHKLLVESDNYITNAKNYFNFKDSENKKLLFYFTVTTNCGLRCKYCFQNHIERQNTSIETIKQFGNWVREYLETSSQKTEEIILILFGGDPIICPELSCVLLSTVKETCKQYSLKMRSIMVTNGLEINGDIINKLIKSGLQSMQVTFDGPRKIHNLTRPKTYDIILNNLKTFQDHFNLKVKYNISKKSSNVKDFKEFLNDLEKQKIKKDYIIGIEALQETITNMDSNSECFEYNNKKLGKVFTRFARIGHERGFRISLKSAFQPPCMFTSENCYMIDTNGDIINCDTAYNIKDFKVGNIHKTSLTTLTKKKNRELIFKLIDKNCAQKNCPYLPICETGCYFNRYIKNKNFEDVLCREDYLNSFFPELTNLFLRKET